MELVQYSDTLPGGSWQGDSGIALPHRVGAAGSRSPAMHCLSGWGQGAVPFLQRTASLPVGSG